MCNILWWFKIKYGAIKGSFILTISDVLPSFLECQEPLHHGGFRVHRTLQIRIIRQNFNIARIRLHLYELNIVKNIFFSKHFYIKHNMYGSFFLYFYKPVTNCKTHSMFCKCVSKNRLVWILVKITSFIRTVYMYFLFCSSTPDTDCFTKIQY